MGRRLPECDYRIDIADSDRIYCRHTAVSAPNNLVPAVACRVCPQRTRTCDDPRPVPSEEELQVALTSQPQMPGVATQAWNIMTAARDFVADGFRTVTAETYQARLSICDECEQRHGDRCLKCGCFLTVKAKGRTFECPLNKWPETPE